MANLTAGLGLALIACRRKLGPLLIAATGPILALIVAIRLSGAGLALGSIVAALVQPLLLSAELLLIWWLYHDVGKGSRRLVDPRSAILYLLVAVFIPACFAPVAATLQLGLGGAEEPIVPLMTNWWLAASLGLVLLGPPLLVLAPGWMLAAEEIRPETLEDAEALSHSLFDAEVPTVGDRVESLGLALAAGGLGVVLVLARPQQDPGWPLWGGTLLLTVWASLRQGLRGGTLAASAAALFPLVVLQRVELVEGPALVQASLLAQCAVALLVASSFTWIRFSESRYRQVVGHVPVVLYSVRFLDAQDSSNDGRGGIGRFPRAEVTLVSAASMPLMGCAPGDLLGDHARWLARVHPQDREVVLAALRQLAMQKQPVVCEYRLVPEGGDVEKATSPGIRWMRDTLAPRFDAAGRLIGWEGAVTEITEQRVLADDLRRTTTMFHVLVTNLPAGVFFVQAPTGRPLLVNARARQLLGQREDASASLAHLSSVYRLFRPDGTPYPVEELPVVQALKYGRTTMRDDIVVHRPDGRRVPLVSWAAPLRLAGQGKEDAAVWVLEDLTAVHQAEAARSETERRLRAIIETMGEGLIVLDRHGKVVDCNTAASSSLQIGVHQLTGKVLDDLLRGFVGEDESPLREESSPVAQVLRSGRPVRNLLLGLRSSHEQRPRRWVLLNAMPLGQPGALVGVVITLADVTAAREGQEVLRLSEERYRGLVETLPLMLVQVNTAMQIEYVNPATTEVAGYPLEEVRQPSEWMRVIHPEDLPRLQEVMHRALAGEAVRCECRYQTREGDGKVGLVLAHPRWLGERVVGVTCLILDLTRERQLEQELQRSQRLQLIGRLSSGVAHDFNNLLTVVLNLSALSLSDLPPGHPVQENLRGITEACEQAANLAGQLLAFSRQQQIVLRVVDLNRAARRTLQLVRVLLPGTINLTTELASEELPVRADETQLQQVLLNLCLNARDAMPRGGCLRVSTRRGCNAAGVGPCILLCVEDDGEGMSDEVRASVFRPFYTTKESGTGLGLFVVQQIVESYGGKISVWSEPGRGSRFEIILPLDTSDSQVVY
jgi:PAS domain S-box-containing protein